MEQKKIRGPEWEPQVKQTALLASPIYMGQAQGEETKHLKRGAKRDWGLPSCSEQAMATHSSTFAWKIPWTEAAVHGVAKSWTRLSLFTFTFHFHALEKEMATHSSVLAWRIPGMGEPGGLPSMGSRRVGHDWSDLAAVAAHASRVYYPLLAK